MKRRRSVVVIVVVIVVVLVVVVVGVVRTIIAVVVRTIIAVVVRTIIAVAVGTGTGRVAVVGIVVIRANVIGRVGRNIVSIFRPRSISGVDHTGRNRLRPAAAVDFLQLNRGRLQVARRDPPHGDRRQNHCGSREKTEEDHIPGHEGEPCRL